MNIKWTYMNYIHELHVFFTMTHMLYSLYTDILLSFFVGGWCPVAMRSLLGGWGSILYPSLARKLSRWDTVEEILPTSPTCSFILYLRRGFHSTPGTFQCHGTSISIGSCGLKSKTAGFSRQVRGRSTGDDSFGGIFLLKWPFFSNILEVGEFSIFFHIFSIANITWPWN